MNEIGANPGHWGKHFKLMVDIDMSDLAGAAFNVIGTGTFEAFNGVFDGNGHTISNFRLTSVGQRYTGLFGYVTGQVENLGLVNPNIFATGGTGYVGSLAGYLEKGIITGCYAKNASISGDHTVGGLVGWAGARVVDCSTSGTVSGDSYVGGLTGLVADGTVTRCYSNASVWGNRDVGGLAGKTVQETSTITNCYATGDVTGDMYVGGLLGVSEQGATYKCYSVGRVTGNRSVGGLVGEKFYGGRVLQCFWDTEASGQPTSAGGTGKTTAEMQVISTFSAAGWDFWSTWTVCAGINYPVLLWQIPVGDFVCPDGVNFIDFAFFAARWHRHNCNAPNSYCNGTDLDPSGTVDFKDLGIFAESWLEGIIITEEPNQ